MQVQLQLVNKRHEPPSWELGQDLGLGLGTEGSIFCFRVFRLVSLFSCTSLSRWFQAVPNQPSRSNPKLPLSPEPYTLHPFHPFHNSSSVATMAALAPIRRLGRKTRNKPRGSKKHEIINQSDHNEVRAAHLRSCRWHSRPSLAAKSDSTASNCSAGKRM